MMPIQGAEAGGAAGFFKGFGKGLVGYVARSLAAFVWREEGLTIDFVVR